LTFRHDAKLVRGPRLRCFDNAIARLYKHGAENRPELASAGFRHLRHVGGDDPHVSFDGEDLSGLLVNGRCDDRLDERRDNRLRRRDVDGSIEADDPAEGRKRVGVTGANVCVGGRAAGCGSARVRVLDNGRRGFVELEHDAGGRVEIEEIRVRQLLALQHFRRAERRPRIFAIPGGFLMRVLAVPEITKLPQRQVQRLRCQSWRVQKDPLSTADLAMKTTFIRDNGRELGRNRRVVGTGMGEGLPRELESEVGRRPCRTTDLLEHRTVIVGRHHDEDVLKIFRRRPYEARPADVDLFNQYVERRLRIRCRFHKRIQVDDDNVDQRDAVCRRRGEVVRPTAARKNPPVHQRMESLHTTVHHFGKAGDLRDADDGKPCLLQSPRGPARRHQLEAAAGKSAGKVDQASLVGNAYEGSRHKRRQLSGLRCQQNQRRGVTAAHVFKGVLEASC